MPKASLRPCAQPGCPALVERGRCAAHTRRRQLDERRGSARERGYDSRWERARTVYLQEHPLCVHCEAARRVTPASLIDHVTPHRGDRFLFWLGTNWQGLCSACHATKGARESGLAPCAHGLTAQVETLGAVCALCGAKAQAGKRCA